MIRKRDFIEVYAREVNEPVTLDLFLHARIYGCKYEKSNTLAQALYFAPHFGQTVARDQPMLRPGISYIARIETVDVSSTWDDFVALVETRRSKKWRRQHEDVLERLHAKWGWSADEKRSYAFLDRPHLAFAPPIRKRALQAGHGFLSKRSFTFAELFKAWGSPDLR